MADRKNNETTSWNADEVRRQQTQRKQRKKMRRTRFWAIYCAGVGLGSCLLAGLGWLMVNDVCALNKAPLTATVEIEKGDSVGQIASKLKKAGIIKYKLLFVITSPLFHAKDTIQPGSYELNTDMDYNCIIDSMQQGSSVAETVKVTIPEGYSVQEPIQLLADSDVSNVEDLTEAAKNHVFDYTFVDNENLGSITRLEGFLFPDTYEFFHKEDAVSALDRLLSNFQTRVSGDLLTDIENSQYSLREIVTLASIIEKEAIGDDEERPTSPPCSITASAATTPRSAPPSSPMLPSTTPCKSPAWTIPSSPRIWTAPTTPTNTAASPPAPSATPVCPPSRRRCIPTTPATTTLPTARMESATSSAPMMSIWPSSTAICTPRIDGYDEKKA